MTIFKTFKDFIKTGPNEDDIHDLCGKFIEESKGKPLYRGYGMKAGALVHGAREVEIRQDRKPRDSDITVHHLMDAYFQKRFNAKVRSAGLFATGDDEIANKYGAAYYVFPIGDFKFVWGTYRGDAVSDTLYFSKQIKHLISVSPRTQHDEITKDILDEVSWHTDNLAEAIDSGAEIAIMAKSALIVPVGKKPYSEIIKR